MFQSMCAPIIVFCSGRDLRRMINALYVMHQGGKMEMKKKDSSKCVAAFSIDSKAEKDFCFQKNSRGGIVAQSEEETSRE